MKDDNSEPKGMVKQSMRQTKLYYYLSRFTETDHASFLRFIESPYFNRDQVVIRYYQILKEIVIDAETEMERMGFWALLYPEKPYKANRFRKVGTALQQLIRDFIIQQSLERAGNERSVLFLRGLNHHQFDHYFEQNYKRACEALEENKTNVADPFQIQLYLDEQFTYYDFRQPSKPTEKSYHKVIESMDLDLLFQKLKYATLAMNYDMAIGTVHQYDLMEEIVAYASSKLDRLPPLIKAYYFVYRGMTEPEDPSHYFNLKEVMTQHARGFVRSQSMELYTAGLNYIVRKLNEGNREFIPEIVALYEELLKDGVILEAGQISRQNYKNITTMMCRIKQYDWTARFLETYKDQVLSDPEEVAYLYNKAVLAFHQGQFLDCYRLLHRFIQGDSGGKDEFYELDVRRYLCMSLFEIRDYDLLEFQINAFQNYLPRNKRISDVSKRNYIRFTRILGQLLKAETGTVDKRHARFEKINKNLENVPGTELFNWLKAKVKESKTRI